MTQVAAKGIKLEPGPERERVLVATIAAGDLTSAEDDGSGALPVAASAARSLSGYLERKDNGAASEHGELGSVRAVKLITGADGADKLWRAVKRSAARAFNLRDLERLTVKVPVSGNLTARLEPRKQIVDSDDAQSLERVAAGLPCRTTVFDGGDFARAFLTAESREMPLDRANKTASVKWPRGESARLGVDVEWTPSEFARREAEKLLSLDEVTMKQLRTGIDGKIRKRADPVTCRLVSLSPSGVMTFYSSSVTTWPGTRDAWTQHVQLVDWEEAIATLADGANFMDAANLAVFGDVRVSCNCPSFLYHGYKYILTQLDALYPPAPDAAGQTGGEERFPQARNPELEGVVCKHLSAVLYVSTMSISKVASLMKEMARVGDVEIPKSGGPEEPAEEPGAEEPKKRSRKSREPAPAAAPEEPDDDEGAGTEEAPSAEEEPRAGRDRGDEEEPEEADRGGEEEEED